MRFLVAEVDGPPMLVVNARLGRRLLAQLTGRARCLLNAARQDRAQAAVFHGQQRGDGAAGRREDISLERCRVPSGL